MRLKQLNEGYKVLPAINKEKYQARNGLEGPFSTLSGKVVYYDPKEGSYYDPDTDMYMSYDEFQNYDKDYSGMKDERDEVEEASITEGTWAIPNTAELVAKLENAMRKPIPAKDASDMMYSLIGDDELFDSLGELEDDNPESDARPTIQRWLSANDELLSSNIDDQSVMSALRKMADSTTVAEAEGEVHTVYIDGKKWKSFYKKETADKAAATITARGKKAEVKTGPAPQFKPRAETPMPRPKPQDPKQKAAMDKALKSIEMSFGPERKAITDQVIAMSRTAEMLTNPAWADRAWKNVDQYGIKDKADLVRELQMMIADEQRVQDDDLDGHIYGPDSNIRQMRKALDKIS